MGVGADPVVIISFSTTKAYKKGLLSIHDGAS